MPIRFEPEPKNEVDYLAHSEVAQLLAALPEHCRAPVQFALATGLRRDNIFNLQWSWIDLPRKVAIVPASQAKANRTLPVPLNSDAVKILLSLPRNSTHVFTYEGKPFAVDYKTWHRALKKAGLRPSIRFHDLRHTWASWHVMSGTSLYDLMKLGGWSTMAMVQRYAHLSTEHLLKAAENVASKKTR